MIETDIKQLNTMNTTELKKMFLRYFRYTPIKRGKEFYVSSIAYRMQELEFGGLPTTTKNLLIQMHTKTAPQKKKTIAPIGTRIIKTYKGQEYVVRVLENGFDLDGKHFKTLSGMAKKITGMKISGKVFFNLGWRDK